MRATARAAAVGAVIVLAGCLDAPAAGDADETKIDAGAVTSSPDGGTCEVATEGCGVLAGELRDDFENAGAWSEYEGNSECEYAFGVAGGGVTINRTGAGFCYLRSAAAVDLRCSSVYVHFDGTESFGADASFSIFLPDGTYYFIERNPPTLEAGACDPTCRTIRSVAFQLEEHIHLRLRATSQRLVAEVGGPDEGLEWTELGVFEDVDPEDLSCVTLELGNYQGGDVPSSARFYDLNL